MLQGYGDKRFTRYEEIRKIVEIRGSDKRIFGDGRKARGYSLSNEGVNEILEEWNGSCRFVSPYKRGIRTDLLITLVNLGINKAHSLSEIKLALRKLMTDADHIDKDGMSAWDKFEHRSMKRRGDSGGKDISERILDNYRSFRRLCTNGGLNPYGFRLKQLGCCIDFFRQEVRYDCGKDERFRSDYALIWYIRLNSYSVESLNIKVKSREDIPPVDFSGRTFGPINGNNTPMEC